MDSGEIPREFLVCRYCTWWGVEGDWPPLRGCLHPSADTNKEDSMAVHNGEPYNEGSVATGPEFSCIHWREKEETFPHKDVLAKPSPWLST